MELDVLQDVCGVNTGHAEEPNSFPLASDPRALCSDRVPVFPRCALNALEMCVSVRSRSHDPAWVSSATLIPGRVSFMRSTWRTLQVDFIVLILIRELVSVLFFFFCMSLFSNLRANTKPRMFTSSVQLQFGEHSFPQTQRAVVTNVVFLDLTDLAAAVFAVISS